MASKEERKILFSLRAAIISNNSGRIREQAKLIRPFYPTLALLISMIEKSDCQGDALQKAINRSVGQWLLQSWHNNRDKLLGTITESFQQVTMETDPTCLTVHSLRVLFGLTPAHILLMGAMPDIYLVVSTLSQGQIDTILTAQDYRGMTPLHVVATQSHHAKHNMKLFELMSPSRQSKLFQLQDTLGKTVMHYLASHVDLDPDIVVIMRGQAVSQSLLIKDSSGQTPVHIALAAGHDAKTSPLMLAFLPCANLPEALMIQDNKGYTPLHLATALNPHSLTNIENLSVLANNIPLDQLTPIFRRQLTNDAGYGGDTIFHTVVRKQDINYTESLLKLHDRISLFNVLQLQNESGNTVLHHAAKLKNLLRILLETLCKHEHLVQHNDMHYLLKTQNSDGDTFLHIAANHDSAIITNVYEHLKTSSYMGHLLDKRNDAGENVLHRAARKGKTQCLRAHLDLILCKEVDRLDLLSVQDQSKVTPGELIAKDPEHLNYLMLAMQRRPDAEIALTYKCKNATSAIDLTCAKLKDDCFGSGARQKTLHYLSPADSQSNNHALIFYNTKNREGALEEAMLLKGSFSSLGMTTTFEEWEHFLGHEKSLRKRLQDCMNAIKETCSLLIVCVMAHGKRGLVIDSFGLEGEINGLFELVTESMPENIPVVFIIQACQNSNSALPMLPPTTVGSFPVDASRKDPNPEDANSCSEYERSITLRRPHTALLLATVPEGVAYRRAFTDAISKQVYGSDGATDIYFMHMSAVAYMEQQGCFKGQIPKFESTLKRRLCLPSPVK